MRTGGQCEDCGDQFLLTFTFLCGIPSKLEVFFWPHEIQLNTMQLYKLRTSL